jgi:hypothetical protein
MSTEIRAALLQQAFPVDARQLGDTVLIGRGLEPAEAANEIARAQVYALQNVVPTQRGWCSVHYAKALDSHSYSANLRQVVQLRNGTGRTALCGIAGNTFYVYSTGTLTWTEIPIVSALTRGDVTAATFRGETYVCVGRIGLFKYNFTTETMDLLTLGGIADFADVRGVCAAGNHLVLITADLFMWSDPIDPLEFTPAAGSAGSTGIAANRSSMTVVAPLGDGIVVYTTLNAVYAAYTGNPNAPFAFREITGSAGVESPEHVSNDVASAEHLAWTYSGFQRVSAQRAEQAWPELSDSIAAGVVTYIGNADYPVTLQYDRMRVKVSTIGARYIIVSVRSATVEDQQYAVAYVYDTALERFGRLDIPHSDVIEYRAAEYSRYLTINALTSTIDSYAVAIDELREEVTAQAASFGTMFAIVQQLGSVHVALPAAVNNVAQFEVSNFAVPALIAGKYRMLRGSAVRMESLQLQGIAADAIVQVLCQDAAGNHLRSVVPTASLRESGKYALRATGHSVAVRLSGVFNLYALSFELANAGSAMAPSAISSTAVIDYVTAFGAPVTVGGEYVISGL